MKKILFIIYSICLLSATTKNSYNYIIPSADIKKLDGSPFNSDSITNNGKPIVIIFWTSYCKTSLSELDAIEEVYAQWQKETGVKLAAIATDDPKTFNKIKGVVDVHGWSFDIYTDANSDFKRAMNVVNCPHIFLLNGKRKIVWQASSYISGDENELYDQIKKIKTQKP